MKILILGMGPSREQARPDEYTETWGLPWSKEWHICHRLFEMHDWRLVQNIFHRPGDYSNRLKSITGTLYMRDARPEFPASVRFPLESIQRTVFGKIAADDYLCSSVAYMLALAIHLRPDRIAVYGVDVRGKDRFTHQRPNLEFLLGVAAGRGINIDVPDESELLRYESRQEYGHQIVHYPVRYGELPKDWSIGQASERVA